MAETLRCTPYAGTCVNTGGERRRWRGGVLMLFAFDVMAFSAAVWLAIAVPEALETAASSANASMLDAVPRAGNSPRGGS